MRTLVGAVAIGLTAVSQSAEGALDSCGQVPYVNSFILQDSTAESTDSASELIEALKKPTDGEYTGEFKIGIVNFNDQIRGDITDPVCFKLGSALDTEPSADALVSGEAGSDNTDSLGALARVLKGGFGKQEEETEEAGGVETIFVVTEKPPVVYDPDSDDELIKKELDVSALPTTDLADDADCNSGYPSLESIKALISESPVNVVIVTTNPEWTDIATEIGATVQAPEAGKVGEAAQGVVDSSCAAAVPAPDNSTNDTESTDSTSEETTTSGPTEDETTTGEAPVTEAKEKSSKLHWWGGLLIVLGTLLAVGIVAAIWEFAGCGRDTGSEHEFTGGDALPHANGAPDAQRSGRLSGTLGGTTAGAGVGAGAGAGAAALADTKEHTAGKVGSMEKPAIDAAGSADKLTGQKSNASLNESAKQVSGQLNQDAAGTAQGAVDAAKPAEDLTKKAPEAPAVAADDAAHKATEKSEGGIAALRERFNVE